MSPLVIRVCLLLSAFFCAVCHLRLASVGAPIYVDDAYYYIIPAQNWWDLGFFSFDGQEATNGFHPLWAWLNVVCVYPFQKAGEVGALVGISAVQSILYLGLVFAAGKILFSEDSQETYVWKLAWAGPLMWLLYPQVTDSYLINGMESTLALVLFCFTCWALTKENWKWLSVALPLLMLSRLDTLVFVSTPILIFVLLRKDLVVRKKVLLAIPLITCFALYSGLNWAQFSEIKPISGILKSSFPLPTLHLHFLLDEWLKYSLKGAHLSLLLTPNLLTYTGLIICSTGLLFRKRSPLIWLFWGISCLFLINILIFQKWNKGVGSWYFVLPFGSILFLLAQQLGSVVGSVWIKRAVLGMLLLSLPTHVYRAVKAKVRGDKSMLNLVQAIKTTTGEDDVIAGTDVGYIAYFSGRNVVNLDGLINNYRYQEFLKEGRLNDYLQEKKVSYLVSVFLDKAQPFRTQGEEKMYAHRIDPDGVSGQYDEHEFKVYSYRYESFSDPVILRPQAERFRGEQRRFGDAQGVRLLFELNQGRE
ncbi:MAG: hypothetical protein CMK59_09780 [Proteobacteria bacterium]|nr:hypothetical protein [Pseudomonadota bacterium]